MKNINLSLFYKEIDLSDKLSEKKSTIKIIDDLYTVHDGFKDILEVDKLMKNKAGISDIDMMTKFFMIVLGKEDGEKLLEKNYPMMFYKEVMSAILDIIKGEDEEGK